MNIAHVIRRRPVVKAVPCTPDGARCAETPDAKRRTPACCVAHNVTVLRAVADALNEAGIPWWIDYGMLLGFCTNGGFFWNDKDTDICALVDDRAAVLALAPAWEAASFHTRYYPVVTGRGKEWTWGDVLKVRLSKVNHNNCDITFWFRRPDGYLDRTNYGSWDQYRGRAMPEGWVFPTKPGTWEGLTVQVPAEPEKLVEHRYGKGWRSLPAARHDRVRRK